MKAVSTCVSILICFTLMGQNDKSIETCLTENEFDDRYASYSSNGQRIVFESNRDGDWQIFLMDSNGENVEKLTINHRINRRPTWHPNGKIVLFESSKDGAKELRIIKVKSKKERIIKPFINKEFLFAAFSPNGKKIAVSLKESDDKSNIVILDKKGKLEKKVTKNNNRNYYPKWSKDGKELVYFSRKDTENKDDEIYRINIKTDKEIRLTNWPKNNFCPSWSADDTKIVYVTSMDESRPEIYIMNIDGNNKKRITHNEDGDTLPNWHPLENKILITGYRNGNYEICELKLTENNN
ncbi:PD40 domain-containing protein [Winogradskyella haliclonae]|uniref:DUF5050 domain-containing protein n=1 Tax=Winogradskyella haliclonae TaxID=2048558 RepID=A0ABQ2C076_9FLAO|nr:PD40 domain-containing protein [Winogradskyella haliclonae]GGI57601.1 hypothetical protein GCM10011444_19100 [Winogradskyella haliclonae]